MANARHATFAKRLWTPQTTPMVPVELDRNHPLAAGLVACVLAGQPLDLAGQGAFSPGTPLAPNALNRRGLAFAGAVTSATNIPAQFQAASLSLGWVGTGASSISTYSDLIGIQITAAPYDVISIIGDGTGNNLHAKMGFGTAESDGTVVPVADFSRSAVATYQFNGSGSPAACTIVGNGGAVVQTDAPYPGGYSPPWSSSPRFAVGGPSGWTSNLGMLWTRLLSVAEAAWFDAEPFGMFRPRVRRDYYAIAASSSGVRHSLLMGVSG